jgi:hypothetical protein
MKFAKVETTIEEKNSITGDYESADYLFYCEGCKCHHGVWTTNKNRSNAIWDFNGDVEHPTVSPSILVRWTREKGNDIVCHSFIRNGFIEYLSDSSHFLAGKTVELTDID